MRLSRDGHHKQILRSSGKLKLPGAPFAVFVLLRPVMALDLAGGERVGTGDRPQELGSFHSAGSWSRARPHSAAAVAGRCIDCRSGPAKPLNFIPAVEASAEGGTLAHDGLRQLNCTLLCLPLGIPINPKRNGHGPL